MKETGTTSYLDRMGLTKRVDDMLEKFFTEHRFKMVEHGYDLMLRDEPGMKSMIKKLKVKNSLAALRVRFSPDFILSHGTEHLFFIDSKASITPLFFPTQIDRIVKHSGEILTRWDIGEIEREAWFIYNRFFPEKKVALVDAVPYNPKLILAEWASETKCLWCLKKGGSPPIPWDCNECPTFEKEGIFNVMVNEFAGGSGTPHTNIHLGKMRSLRQFLEEEFSLEIDDDWYTAIEEEIKTWGLNKPRGRVNWTQFNNVINDLKKKCPWLKNRTPINLDESQSQLNGYD